MSKSYKLCFLCLMFALNACQKESKYCKQVIDLDPFFKNSKELLLSEIASDVTYIPLETSPECLIGRIDKIISFDDKYYILDRQTESILVFDSTGKYLFKIAQIGNGPGEYIQIADFTILPADSSICLLDDMKVKFIKYDKSGRLIQEKRLHALSDYISVLNDSLIVLEFNYPDFVDNDCYSLSIYDKNLNKLKSIIKGEADISTEDVGHIPGHDCTFFANVDDTLTFWEFRDNIVYKITEKGDVINKYHITYSNGLAQGDQTGYFEVPQRNNDLIVLMETRNFMFMRGTTYGNTFRIIYFKNQNVGYNIIDHNKGEIKNDLDGGPDFFPEKGTVYGECVYKSFSVYEFISDKKSNQQPVPEQFASHQANLNDNPCIMRVTLK